MTRSTGLAQRIATTGHDHRRPLTALVLTVGALLSFACSGGTAGSTAKDALVPCSLIMASELATITGKPIQVEAASMDPRSTECTFHYGPSGKERVSVALSRAPFGVESFQGWEKKPGAVLGDVPGGVSFFLADEHGGAVVVMRSTGGSAASIMFQGDIQPKPEWLKPIAQIILPKL